MARIPLALDIELSSDSEVAFSQAMQFAEKHLQYSGKQILELAAFNFTQSGVKNTKKARKGAKRKVVRWQKSRTAFPRFGVIAYSQKRPARALPVRDRTALTMRDVKTLHIAQVPNIGAGKGSWWGMFRDLHKAPGSLRGPDVSTARHIGSTFHPAIELINKLSYLLKIAPTVQSIAMANAAKNMAIRTQREVNRALKIK